MNIHRYSIPLLVSCLGIWAGVSASFAQNTPEAQAQHKILGQNASQAGFAQSRPNTHPNAQWFPKAGLGLFVHFGIASVHGGIDLSWGMYANKSWEDGELAPEKYWALADQWNPKHFNPDQWVKLAAEAGFQYIVFTTKHHDGYTMWPSRYGNLGVRQKLDSRDLVREFVDACRKYRVKIGLYYSPPDWYFDAPYMNWDYSGRQVLNTRHQPIDRLPAKPAGHDQKRRDMVANQVRELLTQYGHIDIMWFDGGQGEISNEEVRRLQPGIIINRRNGEIGDFGDSEGCLPTKKFKGWFETNDPCWPNRWWTYSTSDRMATAGEVIENLVIMRSWGGNYLANVGPMPDGNMPPEALQAWREMAQWMKHSGESVIDVQAGPFPEKANQPVTVKNPQTLYAHAFPNCHQAIVIRGISAAPARAILLRTGDSIPVRVDQDTLTISIPPALRSRLVDTVKLEWDHASLPPSFLAQP